MSEAFGDDDFEWAQVFDMDYSENLRDEEGNVVGYQKP